MLNLIDYDKKARNARTEMRILSNRIDELKDEKDSANTAKIRCLLKGYKIALTDARRYTEMADRVARVYGESDNV